MVESKTDSITEKKKEENDELSYENNSISQMMD